MTERPVILEVPSFQELVPSRTSPVVKVGAWLLAFLVVAGLWLVLFVVAVVGLGVHVLLQVGAKHWERLTEALFLQAEQEAQRDVVRCLEGLRRAWAVARKP